MRLPSDSNGGFSLRIARSMAGLQQLGGWVDHVSAALGLSRTTDYALRLCAEEAAANVVMHGATCGAEGEDSVVLRVEPAPAVLCVTIEDHCAPFDPLAVPTPAQPKSLQDAQVGGWGVHLMRRYAQEIHYERRDGVNCLKLLIGRG